MPWRRRPFGIERRAQLGGLGLFDEADNLGVARDLDDAERETSSGVMGKVAR